MTKEALNKKNVPCDEKILSAILKFGGHVNRLEDLFGVAGNPYAFKGMIIRVALSCLLCTLIGGVTLIFIEEDWFGDAVAVFFYVFFLTLFVETTRFISCRLYAKYFKRELSDIMIVILTGILSAVSSAVLFFFLNKLGIHNLFMNKPWPVLSLVSFLFGFIIMGLMVLYSRVFGNLKGTINEIQELYLSVLKVLSAALEIKDSYTWGHSDRVSLFTTALAMEWGLEDKDVELVKEVAIFHDIGKIGIPESVLRKSGPLDEEEWELIKKHPLMSEKILAPLKYLKEGLPIVRSHHERYDGKGYPFGLSGDQIPIGAQLIALADTLDTLTSDRSYHQSLSLEEARRKIEESSGLQFDPSVVNIFLRLWEKKLLQPNIEKNHL